MLRFSGAGSKHPGCLFPPASYTFNSLLYHELLFKKCKMIFSVTIRVDLYIKPDTIQHFTHRSTTVTVGVKYVYINLLTNL